MRASFPLIHRHRMQKAMVQDTKFEPELGDVLVAMLQLILLMCKTARQCARRYTLSIELESVVEEGPGKAF
jgi:hypothetical protein